MDCRIKQQETMKSNFMKRAHHYLLLNILLLSQLLQAQNPPGFGDDVQDVPTSSIDCWIIPMFILGVFLMSCNYKKQQKQML